MDPRGGRVPAARSRRAAGRCRALVPSRIAAAAGGMANETRRSSTQAQRRRRARAAVLRGSAERARAMLEAAISDAEERCIESAKPKPLLAVERRQEARRMSTPPLKRA